MGGLRPQLKLLEAWPTSTSRLTMFILKSKRPEKYRDNLKVEHAGELKVITERLAAARKRLQGHRE